jgi:catechol 2,3-dioxygenase-like lactoylglutathione lyase family enzyme
VLPFVELDHVQLAIPTGGECRAREFYVDVLGLDEVPKPAALVGRGGIWLESGGVRVHLGVDPDFRPARKAHPAFRCADYESLLLRVKNHGVDVTDDDDRVDGKRHCYLTDPFGNRIELIERRRA